MPVGLAVARLRFLLLGAALAVPGCAARVETPVARADSTLAYPSREPGGVEAEITLCRALSKKTGKPVDAGQVFHAGENAKVRALVRLDSLPAAGARDLMFHLVWMGPGGEEVFRKRVDYSPSDTARTLESSLSLPPERRDPGRYALQVYLFRELIAEKQFEVRPPEVADAEAPRAAPPRGKGAK